jgi:hypothetical protein
MTILDDNAVIPADDPALAKLPPGASIRPPPDSGVDPAIAKLPPGATIRGASADVQDLAIAKLPQGATIRAPEVQPLGVAPVAVPVASPAAQPAAQAPAQVLVVPPPPTPFSQQVTALAPLLNVPPGTVLPSDVRYQEQQEQFAGDTLLHDVATRVAADPLAQAQLQRSTPTNAVLPQLNIEAPVAPTPPDDVSRSEEYAAAVLRGTIGDEQLNQIALDEIVRQQSERDTPLTAQDKESIIRGVIASRRHGEMPRASDTPSDIAQKYAQGQGPIENYFAEAGRVGAGYAAGAIGLVSPQTGEAVQSVAEDRFASRPGLSRFLGSVTGNVAAFAPALANPALAAPVIGGMTATSAGQSRIDTRRERAQGQDISGATEAGRAAGNAAAELLGELATLGIFKRVGRELADSVATNVSRAVRSGSVRELAAAVKPLLSTRGAGVVGRGMAEEGTSEAATQVMQNLVSDRDVTEGVGEAFAQGAVAGGAMAPVAGAAQVEQRVRADIAQDKAQAPKPNYNLPDPEDEQRFLAEEEMLDRLDAQLTEAARQDRHKREPRIAPAQAPVPRGTTPEQDQQIVEEENQIVGERQRQRELLADEHRRAFTEGREEPGERASANLAFESQVRQAIDPANQPGAQPEGERFYTREQLIRMPKQHLRRVAEDMGVAYDTRTSTLPRILDEQQRRVVEDMTDKQLWDRVRGLGLPAGAREQNVQTLLGVQSGRIKPQAQEQRSEVPAPQTVDQPQAAAALEQPAPAGQLQPQGVQAPLLNEQGPDFATGDTRRQFRTDELPPTVRAEAEKTIPEDWGLNDEEGDLLWSLTEVPVDQLGESLPDELRNSPEFERRAQALARRIAKSGRFDPIVLGPGSIEGQHRIRAAEIAGRVTVPAYQFEQQQGPDFIKRDTRTGDLAGAPEKVRNPKALAELDRHVEQLAREGEVGRFWYEDSSKAIMDVTGANAPDATPEARTAALADAKRLAALVAVFSPNNRVSSNASMAVKAYTQLKAGQPLSGISTRQAHDMAQRAWNGDTSGFGPKVDEFYRNLIRKIDPAQTQGVTVDRWVMRLLGFDQQSPSAKQYEFGSRTLKRVADRMGWEPQQVQAAAWVSYKSRYDAVWPQVRKKAEARGDWDPSTDEWTSPAAEQKYRREASRRAMSLSREMFQTKGGEFNFEHALERDMGQISLESQPGVAGVLDGMKDATSRQKAEFHVAMERALSDEVGQSVILKELGLLHRANTFAPGWWAGESNPSSQRGVLLTKATEKAREDLIRATGSTLSGKALTKEAKRQKWWIDPQQRGLVNAAAALEGLLRAQQAVAWHRPFFQENAETTVRDSNGIQVSIGRTLTVAETKRVAQAVDAELGKELDAIAAPQDNDNYALIGHARGVRFLNFSPLDNATFHEAVTRAAERALGDEAMTTHAFRSEGELVANDWSKYPNGEAYYRKAVADAQGRSDLLGRVYDGLRAQALQVRQAFADKYGWGDPGTLLTWEQLGQRARDAGLLNDVPDAVRATGAVAAEVDASGQRAQQQPAPAEARLPLIPGLEPGSDFRGHLHERFQRISTAHADLHRQLDVYERAGHLNPATTDLLRTIFSLSLRPDTVHANIDVPEESVGLGPFSFVPHPDTDVIEMSDLRQKYGDVQKGVNNVHMGVQFLAKQFEDLSGFVNSELAVFLHEYAHGLWRLAEHNPDAMVFPGITGREMRQQVLDNFNSMFGRYSRVGVNRYSGQLQALHTRAAPIIKYLQRAVPDAPLDSMIQHWATDPNEWFSQNFALYVLDEIIGNRLKEKGDEGSMIVRRLFQPMFKHLMKFIRAIRGAVKIMTRKAGPQATSQFFDVLNRAFEGPYSLHRTLADTLSGVDSVKDIRNRAMAFLNFGSNLHGGLDLGSPEPEAAVQSAPGEAGLRQDQAQAPAPDYARSPGKAAQGVRPRPVPRARTLYHFSAQDRTSTGLQREFAGTAFAGQERDRLKSAPDTRAVHFYVPGKRPEPQVATGVMHRVTGEFKILDIDGPEFDAVNKYLTAKKIRGVVPRIRELMRLGYDGIEQGGIVQLYRDVPAAQVEALGEVDPAQRRQWMQKGLPAEEKSGMPDFVRAPRSQKQAGFVRIGPKPPAPTTGARFTLSGESVWEAVRRKVQDEFRPVEKLVKEVKEQGGNVSNASDPYLHQELFQGRVGTKVRAVEDDFVKPIVERMTAAELSVADVDKYLIALHAAERNAQVATVNPAMPDGGSGMNNADAAAHLATIAASGKQADYDFIANKVHAMLRRTRNLMVASGLESQATINAWEAAYQNYVPLRTDMEEDGLNISQGQGFAVRGAESQRATGRSSMADSPLTFAVMQAQEKIVRAEKNRVGRSLLRLVKRNPDDDLWTVDRPKLKKIINPRTGLVQRMVDPRFKYADNVIPVKVNGKTHLIEFKGDAGRRIAASVKRLGANQMGAWMVGLSRATGVYRKLQTSLNPEFIAPNLVRDVQTAGINLTAEHGKRMARSVMKGVPKAMKAAYDVLGDEQAKRGAPYHDAMREYLAAGGAVDTFSLDDFNKSTKKLERLLKDANPTTARRALMVVRAAGAWIDRANGAVETAVRLSAYVEARRAGMSTMRAASLAKNLTVNFNRKGEWGTALNTLYLFSNASIQGSTRLLKAVATTQRGRRIAAGMFAAAAAYGIIAPVLFGDDDEGRSRWDLIPDGVKKNHLLIPTGGGSYVSLPLPYGYNVIFNAGRLFGEVTTGTATPGAAGVQLVESALDAFNPLGNEGSLLQTLSPTLLDPFAQAYENKSWTGRPIVPAQAPFGAPKPQSELAMRDTSAYARGIARWLNRISGGDEIVPGKVDVSPALIDHFVGWMAGGAGRTLTRTLDLPGRVVEGDVPVSAVPIVRRFAGQAPRNVNQREFYDLAQKADEAMDRLRDYEKSDDPTRAVKYAKEHEKELAFARWAQHLRGELADLRNAGKTDEVNKLAGDFGRAYRAGELPALWRFTNELAELERRNYAVNQAKSMIREGKREEGVKLLKAHILDEKESERLKRLRKAKSLVEKVRDGAERGAFETEKSRQAQERLAGAALRAGG